MTDFAALNSLDQCHHYEPRGLQDDPEDDDVHLADVADDDVAEGEEDQAGDAADGEGVAWRKKKNHQ